MLLPAPIREPLVALIGDTCYTTLVEDFNITDVPCIKYTISKGLGLGIVLGGAIVKIPQILTIVGNRSARGLSLASYILETLACCITFSYNWRQGNPFSTYGEVTFLTVQNIIITMLILFFSRQYVKTLLSLLGFINILNVLINTPLISPVAMATLYASTIPISLASKIPQIYTNFANKSTGQLSVFAVINYFVGTIARVFTTMTELDDPLMLAGMVLAAVLNGILVIQVILYWGKPVEEKQTKVD